MSFRPMTGPRWRFLSNDPATGHRTVCEASGKLSPAHAKIIGHLLSDDLGTQLYVVAPGRTAHNPAPLGDHVAYPRWIVYGQNSVNLLATLSGKITAAQAKKTAKNIATWLGSPVIVRVERHGGAAGRTPNARRRNPNTMTITKHESAEFSRAAQAMYARGQNDLGHLLSMTAAVLTVPQSQYDRAADAYRAWLVFDEPKANPARSQSARVKRQRMYPYNRKTRRGAGYAWQRPATPGNAAKAIHYLESSKTRRAARSNPRPGKMRVDDYNALRAALEGQLAKWPADAHSQYEAAGLSPMRFRWDLLHASKFPIMPLYAYLNDANVDTALRSILGHGPERETGRKANPKRRITAESWRNLSDYEVDQVAHNGNLKATRTAAKRELARRGVKWTGEGVADRIMGRTNGTRRNPGFPEAPRMSLSELVELRAGQAYKLSLSKKSKEKKLGYLLTGAVQVAGEIMGEHVPELEKEHRIKRLFMDVLTGVITNPGGPRIVYNRLLGGWYVVTGPHQTPLNGRFNSKAEAQAWLGRKANPKGRIGRRLSKAQALTIARNTFGPDALVDKRGQRFAVYAGRTSVQGVWNILGVGRSWDEALEDANRPAGMPHQIMHNPGDYVPNPRVRRYAVQDANGVIFWQGEATSKDEALFMAERSRAGVDGWPPEPWRPVLANPSYRLTGTVEEIPDAPAVARRGPGRPRKVRLAPLDVAPVADAVPFEVPAEAPGRELQAGDRVTVPYSGRASYFGRAATKTRESGIFEGYTYETGERLAFVRINRGKHTVETHAFPVDQVRLHGKSFAEQAAVKRAGRPAKLARLTWKAHGSLAKAEAMLEKATAEHAATEAVAMDLYPQHEAQPGRPWGRTEAASREYLNARAKLRRLTERVELLGSVVRSLGGGGTVALGYGEATGTDPWAANRRRRNPSRPSIDHSMLSPSGRVSGRSWDAARARAAADLFPPGYWDPAVQSAQDKAEAQATALLRTAAQLRDLASRGVQPRKYVKAAEGFERQAAEIRRKANPLRHNGPLQNTRTVRGAKRKRNPRGSERERAVRTFKMWHEFAPHKITRMKGPDRLIPRTLVKLGDIRSIDYISDKYEGRPVTYTHKTDRPRPVLATDPDGQNLHIIGGRVKITGDGLIH